MIAPQEALNVGTAPALNSATADSSQAVSSESQKVEQETKSEEEKPKLENIVIDKSDLKDFVGQPPFTSDRIYDITPPGVVMGLAWCVMCPKKNNNLEANLPCMLIECDLCACLRRCFPCVILWVCNF